MSSPGLLLGDRYQLADRIAAGAMGEIWRAVDLVLGRPVAVKLLRSGRAVSEEDRARFRGEARHASSLSHRGIAQVYDYRDAEPPCPAYLVMELVDGPSLARLLDDGPVDPARTMKLVAQAAAALQAAHAVGLVHRDIKPGNLLLNQDGDIKITDFGIAQTAGAMSVTRSGVLIGTPAYLAPERATGAPATPAADLYALGIVAYQCLTGRLPFEGEPLAVALAHVEQAMPQLPPHVPAGVAALVADLTAKDPRARPASAAQVAERANQLHSTLTGPPAMASAAPATQTWPLPMEAGAASTRRRGGLGRQGRHGDGLGRRHPARLSALVVAAIIAVTAAAGWAVTAGHGPGSVPTSPATQQPVQSSSHSTHRASPTHRHSSTSAAHASGYSTTSPKPFRSSAAPTPRATPTRTPTPAPSPTPSPSGTPSPSATPTPTIVPSTSQSTGQASSGSTSPALQTEPSADDLLHDLVGAAEIS